jgi:hypothetical protein
MDSTQCILGFWIAKSRSWQSMGFWLAQSCFPFDQSGRNIPQNELNSGPWALGRCRAWTLYFRSCCTFARVCAYDFFFNGIF